MALVLASASPRRADILEAAAIEFSIVPSNFDEATLRHLRPRAQARASALGKAVDVARDRPGDWVLGCDTVVALGSDALGKPRDGVEASQMLRRLAGREHEVISAVCLLGPGSVRGEGAGISRVAFRALAPYEIAEYVNTGEPLDKAGAYAIQGAAGEFVALVGGSLDTVIGLPLHVLRRLGRRLGCPHVVANG